jgi:hypothetical protein
MEQLANIGSEVARAARAKATGNQARLAPALERCLDLFELTLADPRWQGRRREICRSKEVVLDFLVGDNMYSSTAESLDRYFLAFARAARRTRPRTTPTCASRTPVRGQETYLAMPLTSARVRLSFGKC